MDTASDEAEAIQRKMADVRRDMNQNMEGMVANVKAMKDWRRYVSLYPWASAALAAAVGYLVVPKRRKLSRRGEDAALWEKTARVLGKPKGRGVLGGIAGVLLTAALRLAKAYAASHVEKLFAGQSAPRPSPAHSGRYRAPQDRPGAPGPSEPE